MRDLVGFFIVYYLVILIRLKIMELEASISGLSDG